MIGVQKVSVVADRRAGGRRCPKVSPDFGAARRDRNGDRLGVLSFFRPVPKVLNTQREVPGPATLSLLNNTSRVHKLPEPILDRQSVVSGKSVSVRIDLGGRGNIKKK